MELEKLLEGIEVKKKVGEVKREIRGVAYHSAEVQPGYLFVAIRGLEVDGHQFIGDAIRRGAEAILLEDELLGSGKTMIVVANSRQALAKASANFFGHPSSRMKLIGVTGTNGKTTTTFLLESIFRKAGWKAGVIGTINYRYGEMTFPAWNTTPESLDLQRILREMVEQGVSSVVMEVSSHGLDLSRVDGCEFDAAVFTNFTSDHLDYHKTLAHYFESKRKLFVEYLAKSPKKGRFAVTNDDDPKGREIVEGIELPVLRYGSTPSCDISADRVQFSLEGLSCHIRTPKGDLPIQSKLVGGFNLHNILAAVATGVGLGIPLEKLKEGIEALEGVSGRFERVENRKGIHVIVDYAHTHDALERALLGLRSLLLSISRKAREECPSRAKVITVFGCGGDRDRSKRPLMGEVAGKYSDLAIVTSDNPRTEDPLAIIDEVERGLKRLGLREWQRNDLEAWREEKGYLKIPDRREAIRMAIQIARPLDAVLIAGKGHEDYQIIGKKKFPFDDRVEARKALEER